MSKHARNTYPITRCEIIGDSMAPEYPDGTIVDFRCVTKPPVGEDILVEAAGFTTFKRLTKIDRKKKQYILASTNRKKYPEPIRVPFRDVVTVSVVDGVLTLRS